MVILPKPPTRDETYLFEDTGRKRLYVAALLSFSCLSSGMWLFVTAHPFFWAYGIVAFITTFYLTLSYLIGVLGNSNRPDIFTDLESKPKVDIYYAICGEHGSIIQNTLTHITAMQRHYGPNARVYILDDSKDGVGQAYEAMHCIDSQITWVRRPNIGEHKKAGNLRYAFAQTRGEYIAIFDADFCPVPDYLDRLLPFMVRDSKIAILQTPQYFSVGDHTTWIGKGSANIQELFYRLIQVNRNTFNGAICVGTNAIYRRVALEPMGGTALIGYSEDVRTGFNVIMDGWKIRYLPYNFAKGLCPDDLPGFVNQQYRWSMGSISLFFSKAFWSANLTVMQRVCYLSGMLFYMTSGLSLITGFIPSALLLIFAPQLIHWYNVIFVLPSLIYGTFIFALWSKTGWGLYTVRSRQASYYCYLLATFDYLRGSLVPWEPTGAVSKKNKLTDRYATIVQVRTYCSAAVVLSLVVYRWGDVHLIHLLPTLVFLSLDVWLNRSILE